MLFEVRTFAFSSQNTKNSSNVPSLQRYEQALVTLVLLVLKMAASPDVDMATSSNDEAAASSDDEMKDVSDEEISDDSDEEMEDDSEEENVEMSETTSDLLDKADSFKENTGKVHQHHVV